MFSCVRRPRLVQRRRQAVAGGSDVRVSSSYVPGVGLPSAPSAVYTGAGPREGYRGAAAIMRAGSLVPKGREERRVLAAARVAEAAAALHEVLADLVDLLERLGHDLALVPARAGVAEPAPALEVVPADLLRDVTRGVEVPGVVVCEGRLRRKETKNRCPGVSS